MGGQIGPYVQLAPDVVLVDAARDDARMLRYALEMDGLSVAHFTDGQAALDALLMYRTEAGRRPGNPRRATLEVNSILAMQMVIRSGLGIGALPDYLVTENDGLVRLLPDLKTPKVDVYFVYPEELKTAKKIQVLRDFLVSKARSLKY